MIKPTINSVWAGQKGNKFRVYKVQVDGKEYYHMKREDAIRQFNAAKEVEKILKKRKGK